MAGEYAFVMKDLRKVVPPKREILRGIYLSFFHGAKIGVLGANGAGKSSLLRIMAGVDRDFLGEAFPADGLRIGYLPQEPQLEADKDVRGNVEQGVAETRALLTRFEEVSARLGEPLSDAEMEKLLEEQARLQDKIDAANAWDLDRTVEMAMDALRVPPGDADVAKISAGSRRRKRPTSRAGARWPASWSGCGWRHARARPRARRGWPRTTRCWASRSSSAPRSSRSPSRTARGSATSSSRRTASARATATAC